MSEPLSDDEIGAIRARADGLRALATRVMCGDDDLVANPHLAIDGAADDIDRLLATIDALKAAGERDRRVAEAARNPAIRQAVGYFHAMNKAAYSFDVPDRVSVAAYAAFLAALDAPAEGEVGR